jgi:hypoxanthine phosphoribosyltransferase
MKRTLREIRSLIRSVILETVRDDADEFIKNGCWLTGEDFLKVTALDPKVHKQRDTETFTVFRTLEDFPKDYIHYELSRLVPVTPFIIANTIKKSEIDVTIEDGVFDQNGQVISFIMPSDDPVRLKVVDQMVEEMVKRCRLLMKGNDRLGIKRTKIECVTIPSSRSSLATEIAEKVSASLGLNFVNLLGKIDNADELVIDEEEFERSCWDDPETRRWRKDEETIQTLRDLLESALKTARSRLKREKSLSIADAFPISLRRHFNIQKISDEGKKMLPSLTGKTVLIIDDNVATGVTSAHIEKILKDEDVNSITMGGYYVAPKSTQARTQKAIENRQRNTDARRARQEKTGSVIQKSVKKKSHDLAPIEITKKFVSQ